MWRAVFVLSILGLSQTQAGGRSSSKTGKNTVTLGPLVPDVRDSFTSGYPTHTPEVSNFCDSAITECREGGVPWTGCYEDRIATCRTRGRGFNHSFVRKIVNSSQEAKESPTPQHQVQIPSSALQQSRGGNSEEEVLLVTTVIDSNYFEVSPPQEETTSKTRMLSPPPRRDGTVMGGSVLFVRVGNQPVRDLSQPIRLTFRHDKQVEDGTCVFWHEPLEGNGKGYWSTLGCETENTATEFICSCNHLSFFAVLVNPELSVDKKSAANLSYLTYIGSALSLFFSIISLIIYIRQHRRRPEKAVSVHMHLTAALICLHLSFLLCSLLVWRLKEDNGGLVCRGLGLFLHWSLLAALTWTALEGFHLYLLLIRVFNIYVRRYILKLSVLGWGLPTLTAVICGISGVYGKYSLLLKDENNSNSTAEICWMRTDFPQRLVVSYITTVALPCLVILCNSCMLGMVVFKLWSLRTGSEGSSWHKMNQENGSRLWKDCATVLGLSCVLGLPWGLASTTYMSLSGIYVFTILNSLQGVFMFLWCIALTCKSRLDSSSSSREPSSQKMMTTSFNN